MFRGPDRLFRRYQQTGEPRLLGAVFDRTAGELLRVALHLTRDRHRAEDLVQTTFLTAIEKARQYDPSRPLLPWLLAILANHAREWHRRDRRPLPVPIPLSAGGDVGDAAVAELAEVCERAIEALPEPYRPVLLLHLRHGLSGQEIAATLGRPDSTVRNQIARGLDLLRRKLPSGIATAVVLGAVHGRGLAAVRSEVLARVPVPVGGAAALVSATGVSLFGVLLMSKKIVASLAVLALVVGGAWYSGVFAGETAAPAPDAATRVAAVAVAEHPTTATPVPAPAPVREAANVAPTEASVGSLHATVVFEEGGAPITGAPCSVRQRKEGFSDRLVAEGVTRTDGTATFEGLVPGEYRFDLDVPGDQEQFTIVAGTVAELRCESARGFRVAGRVVDPDGQPVGGAEVRCARDWFSVLLARTAVDGTFAADHLRSSVQLWAVASGRQPSKRQSFDVSRDKTDMRLVLGGAGTRLSGRVVDEQAQPAANVRIYIGLDGKLGSTAFVQFERHDLRADATGRFAIDWARPGRVCVAAVPNDGDLGRATLHDLVVEDDVPAHVSLQLGDGARVAGVVRHEGAQPIAGAQLSSSSMHYGMDPLGRHHTTAAPDGAFVLRGLLPGRHWLSAERAGNDGGIQAEAQVELVAGESFAWDPVLGEGAPISIRVLGPADEAIARRFVSVEVDGSIRGYSATDAEGRVRFTHMRPVEHKLRVYGADYGVVLVERMLVPGPAEVILRLDASRVPSARISGRIVDARGKPVVDCRVSLNANSGFVQPQRVDREGRFTTDLLPPGRYGLSAQAHDTGLGWAFANATLVADETRDVGDIVLPDTASLAIRVRAADGNPVRDVRLRLGHAREVNSGSDYLEADEVDGAFRQAGINPGAYVVRLFAPGIAPQNVPLTLGAAERRELDLVAERAVPIVLEVRCRLDGTRDSGMLNGQLKILDASGECVVVHRLWPYFDDLQQRLTRLRLGLLPGTYRVHAEEFGGKKTEVEIVVPAAAPAEPFVIDLR